uniref:F-box domain-containing protein n=1 Tax=Tanacetum cinerariifolium TaxID=118510 RepID=A0A699H3F9_TANCI|nr:hypothetical protein [Tanacetum cinerariifolium]
MPRGRKPNRERAEKPKKDWLKLPSDVTRNILYRVGVIDILENAQKVCTAWRKICQDLSIWRVIYVTNFWDPNARPPLQDMYRASNLRRLEAYEDIYNDWSDALKKFALLEELSLYSEEAIQTGCEEMAMAIGKYLPELRHLELIGDSLFGATIEPRLHRPDEDDYDDDDDECYNDDECYDDDDYDDDDDDGYDDDDGDDDITNL